MKRFEFENYEEFSYEIKEKFNSMEENEYSEYDDISIVAKYYEAKEIIRSLLNLGFDLCNIIFELPDWDGYDDEYIVSLSSEGIWCEKFKREDGYFTNDTYITYVMDNCSSVVFKYTDSEEIYEVCVCDDSADENLNNDEENETGNSYTVNSKSVDREIFNEYVSQFAPDLVDGDTDVDDEDTENKFVDSGYSVIIKFGLDTDEVEKIICDMRKDFQRNLSDMFGIPYHPLPLRFFL